MITFAAQCDQGHLLGLGVDAENVKRMFAEQPLRVAPARVGLPGDDMAIAVGDPILMQAYPGVQFVTPDDLLQVWAGAKLVFDLPSLGAPFPGIGLLAFCESPEQLRASLARWGYGGPETIVTDQTRKPLGSLLSLPKRALWGFLKLLADPPPPPPQTSQDFENRWNRMGELIAAVRSDDRPTALRLYRKLFRNAPLDHAAQAVDGLLACARPAG